MDDSPDKTATRTSLINAGLHLFGHGGFDGTSTRQLAARANCNIASISYHFGNKAGLRAACATEVVHRVSQALDGVLKLPEDDQAAVLQIERLVKTLIDLMVGSPDAADMVAFILREVSEPGQVADDVYVQFIEPNHKALCQLWAKATGRAPDDDAVKLAVFALIGQVLYFRIASPFVVRRMSWDTIGPDQTRQISENVIKNLHSMIERQKV